MQVLIVEDNPLLLRSLESNVQSIDPRARVTGAGSLEDAERALAEGPTPDRILLDLGLPDAFGFEALQRLRTAVPDAAIAVVSGYSDIETMRACFTEGATGYIEKSRDPERTLSALRRFLRLGHFIPSEVATAASGR